MRKEELFEILQDIDEEYIEEADPSKKIKHHRKYGWMKWGTFVACFAVIIYVGVRILPQETSSVESDLPTLDIGENSSSSFGFEGYMAYDSSELVDANPWSATTTISTLPVYRNPLSYDENHIASGADPNKMQEFLIEIAERCGIDTNSQTITDDVPDEETQKRILEKLQIVGEEIPEGYFDSTKAIIQSDELKVEVDQAMTATISFEPTVKLPDKYKFTHFASYHDITAVAEYLKNTYKDLIGYDNPQVNIYGGDYNIYNQQQYQIEFFDKGNSETEQIINYNFNRTAFYCDDEGKLFLARVYQPDLSDKVGDYPIITTDKAKKLLAKGNYFTSVPYEMPGKKYINKVELIYRTGEQESYFMPYYRFYVELPEEKRENGLKTYGAYYVPAVEDTYISDMPTWDGSIN